MMWMWIRPHLFPSPSIRASPDVHSKGLVAVWLTPVAGSSCPRKANRVAPCLGPAPYQHLSCMFLGLKVRGGERLCMPQEVQQSGPLLGSGALPAPLLTLPLTQGNEVTGMWDGRG